MEINEIKELIKALDNSNIVSLNITNQEGSIQLKKGDVMQVVAKDIVTVQANDDSCEEAYLVKAPIVGIAYKSPKPGDEPFVKVGQTVVPGQTLCVIEAMKMFNEVKADREGIVSEILFEDGKLVEFDKPLLRIGVME